MKRGAITKKKQTRQIIAWFPDALISEMDHAVVIADVDRSKFLRSAVREKVARILGSNPTAA
jgi:metal-responsive CopG/Arc/MetJ family transcriptional regulator